MAVEVISDSGSCVLMALLMAVLMEWNQIDKKKKATVHSRPKIATTFAYKVYQFFESLKIVFDIFPESGLLQTAALFWPNH